MMTDFARWGVAGALCGVLFGTARPSSAREGVDALPGRLALSPHGYLSVEGAAAPRAGAGVLAFTFASVDQAVPIARPGRGRVAATGASAAEVQAALGLLELGRRRHLALGVGLPFLVGARGGGVRARAGDLARGGVGSLRTALQLGLGHPDDDVAAFAARFEARWPTGPAHDLRSDGDRVQLALGLGAETKVSVLRGILWATYRWQDGASRVGEAVRDDEVELAGALAVAPLMDLRGLEHLELVLEARTRFRALRPYVRSEEAPLTIGTGLRFRGSFFLVVVGGEFGLWRALGAPRRSGWVSVGWTFGGGEGT